MSRKIFAVLAARLALSLPGGALEIPWSSPQPVASSAGMRRVAAGDIDGDGDLDLAIAADTDDEVAWIENTGAGWTLHSITTSADGAIGIALGDVDGNGTLDVIAGMRDANSVRWWSNDNGDGLSWTVEVIASSATGVTDVDVGDIDADGDLDVVGAVTGAGEVRWWQQTASGWTPRVLAGNPTGVNDVALGDADGDGYLDVFGLVPGFSKIVWWENPRPGTGVPWTRIDIDTEDDHVGLAVVDLDRDGDNDVIVGDVLQDTLAWWANDGSGTAGTWTRTSIGGLPDPTSTFPVDLDLDGDVDILATGDGGGGSVGWFENSGGEASWTWHEVAAGAAAFGAVAADTDRDGDPDVAWADPVAGMVEDASNLMAHRGAAFSFEYIGVGGVGLQMLKGPSLGDIDGDGDRDMAVFDRDDLNGALWKKILINLNPGQPAEAGYPYLETHVVQSGQPMWFGFENATDVEIGDLDGDGDGDLLIAQQGSVVNFLSWCENIDGTGTSWSCAKTYDVDDGGAPDLRRNLALGDIDGDGDLDMAAYYEWWDYSGPYGLRWWENLGDMSQSSNWEAHDIVQQQLRDGLKIIDIDGDGDQDVIASEGAMKIFLNNGDGSSWTEVALGLSEEDFAFGDIDLDGDLDIASHTSLSAQYRWWEQQSPTTWVQRDIDAIPFGGGLGADVKGIDLADMDLDGDLDLLGTYDLRDQGTFVEGAYVWYENDVLAIGSVVRGNVEPGWTRHEMPFGGPATPVYGLDLDGDADPEFCVHEYFMWQWIFANGGATIHTAFEGLVPIEAADGNVVTVGALRLEHAGRSGDRDAVLTRLSMRFSDRFGAALSQPQVDALVGSITIRGDDGDGVPESSDPVIVTLTSAPTVTDGMANFAFPGMSSDRAIPCCGQERMFSVWMEVGAAASAAGLPDPVQISFEGPTVSAVDTVDELAVTASPYFADAVVQFTVTAAVDVTIFADGFETGDTTLWSSTTP